ncbi:MAG: hypothetical protein AAF542_23865 [Pseudomonadota bacterium]
MSVSTNSEAADRRQQYLTAMGVDCWLPHTQLPGARKSAEYVRAEPKNELDTRTSSVSGASAEQTAARVPRRTAAEILTEAPVQRKAAAVNRSTISKPSTHASSPVNDSQLNLYLLECAGHCLIIDDAHGSREQLALLHNLMFALSAQPPASYRSTPFDWASIPPQSGDAVDVLRGMVDRAINQHAIHTIVIMGSASRSLFECDADATGSVATPSWLSVGVQVVVTHSSGELLRDPARKADTWAHIQAAGHGAAR